MEQQQLLDAVMASPVIAAVRDSRHLELALASPASIVFLLAGSIGSLAETCRSLRQAGKFFFLHIDLIEGLRPDQQGLRFVAETCQPTGIITTRPACVKWAQSLGLRTVQRLFMLDSTALLEGARHIEACQPDLVEIMPGVSEKAIRLAGRHFGRPLIAGGLIDSREEVFTALGAGALAVSTSQPELWQL